MIDYKSMLDFSGKTVVISGGLGLIGKQVTLAFLQHNANVVVADIDENLFERSFNPSEWENKVSFEMLDISKPDSIERGIKDIINKNNTIDILINTAYPRTSDWGNKIETVNFESWDKNMQMHLGGYFWISKIVLEIMKKNKSGCLINIGSHYGVVGPNFSVYEGTQMTMPVAYSAIKGAIVNLTRYLATYYGPYNIRVNCVCPGGVFDNQDEVFVSKYCKLTPLNRMAKDYEIAMPVLFIASEAASYMTGQIIMVDGGLTTW